MGSRRSRRSHGRVQQSVISSKQKLQQPGVSKLIKKSNRAQQKTAILAAARAARQAARAESPLLVALLSLNNASDDDTNTLASLLHSTETDRTARQFETITVSRCNGDRRQRLIAALDTAKVADIVLLVWSGRTEMDPNIVELLDGMRAQGLPTAYAVAVGSGSDDADLRKYRGRQLAAESLGEDHALRPIRFDLQKSAGAAVANKMSLRRILGKTARVVSWRARYGYMQVEGAAVEDAGNGVRVLSLSGWVRGRGFSANELVHITGYGSFAVGRIVNVSTGEVISVRNAQGEPVESEGEVDGIMGEQTWPPEVGDTHDEEHHEEEDMGKKLAQVYDAAVDEEELADGGGNGEDKDTMADIEEDGDEDQGDHFDMMDESEMLIDEDEVNRIREQAKTDTEFPDEVDTPIDQPARKRFARYRGLKSLRTGEWDPKEQLPKEYAKLFQFRNLAATKKRTLQAAQNEAEEAGGSAKSNFVLSGRKVSLQLLDVPPEVQAAIQGHIRVGTAPLVASGMLRHENRKSVVHFGVQRVDDEETAMDIKAKTPLEMHCGFVRFEGRPMFSENNANSDKHKMERFLRHGRLTVASFYGPAIFAPAPALLCHRGGSLIASGSALGADPDRIILKRIILTGYPFKTQKKRSVAKFMFFNPEDVRWFKPVELWSKLGRSGHIIEPIGTHGHMKCLFDGVIQHHDTVCMTLYKRVYPKLINQQDEHRQSMQ